MPDLPIRFKPARIFELRHRLLPELSGRNDTVEFSARNEEPTPWLGFIGLVALTVFIYAQPAFWLPGSGSGYSSELTGTAAFVKSLPTAHVLGMVGLLGVLFYTLTTGRRIYFTKPQTTLIFLLVMCAFLSMPFAFDLPRAASYFISTVLKLLALYLLTINVIRNMKSVRAFFWVILILGLFPAVGTIKCYLNPAQFATRFGGRAGWVGAFRDPNVVAYNMVMLIAIGLCLYGTARNAMSRVIVGILMSVHGLTVLITLSRTGMVTLAAAACAAVVTGRKRGRILIVAIVFLAAGVSQVPGLVSRAQTIVEYEQDASVMGRIRIWGVALRQGLSNPLFGVGLNSFEVLSEGLIGRRRAVHNSYLRIFAESGIFALGFFIALHAITLRELWHMHRHTKKINTPEAVHLSIISRSLFISIIAVCLVHLTLNQDYDWLLYMFLALAVCVKQIARNIGLGQGVVSRR